MVQDDKHFLELLRQFQLYDTLKERLVLRKNAIFIMILKRND